MIQVGKLNSVYDLSRDEPWPHATRARLDSVARQVLPAAIANVLASSSARNDNSIWMLRHLHLNVELKLDEDDHRMAGHWAHQLLSALTRRIELGPDAGVVRFEDDADLLRSYIADAAGGRTGKWYYQRFCGLEYLSTTAKIRTSVCSNPDVALDALVRMTPHDLRRVVGAISDDDAHRIWDGLSSLLPGARIAPSLPLLNQAWMSEGSALPDGAGEFRWALHHALSALRNVPRESRSWMAAARPVGRLLMVLSRIPREECGRVLDAIAGSRSLDLYEAMNRDDALVVEPLLGCPRDMLESFMEHRPAPPENPERRYTPYGGVFLLLPSLDALPVPKPIEPAPLFRFWILLRCLGGARAMRVFEDPVIRSLFDVDPGLSAESFCRWQSGIRNRWLRISRRLCLASSFLVRDNSRHRTPFDSAYLRLPRLLTSKRTIWTEDTALLVVRSLAWRLPGFSTASLPYLFANVLDFPATVEDFADRRLVRIGSPPLQMLLNMTGICRWQYVVSWLGQKPFELYPEAP